MAADAAGLNDMAADAAGLKIKAPGDKR